MKEDHALQKEICRRFGAEFIPSEPGDIAGVALETVGIAPLNALRHPLEAGTCGWYIWGGEEFSEAPDFFQPVHVSHLYGICPEIIPYLGLAPGWRALISEDHEDVWFDEKLLNL